MSNIQVYSNNLMEVAEKMGATFANSKMFGVANSAQGNILALSCIFEGISPLEFMKRYDIIEGKPVKKTARAYYEFLENGGKVEILEQTDRVCSLILTNKHFVKGFKSTKTIEEAQKAGLTSKNVWQKYPKNMLFKWALRFALNTVEPAIYSEDAEFAEQEQLNIIEEQEEQKPLLAAAAEEVKAIELIEEQERGVKADAENPIFEKLKPFEKEVNFWLRSNKHINQNQTFLDIKPQLLKSVSERTEAFIENCKKTFKEEK